MDFDIVLACDSDGGIGIKTADNKNTIPWKIAEDMKFFRELTKDVDFSIVHQPNSMNSVSSTISGNKINAIIMGRATADTFAKIMPDRINIVISSVVNYRRDAGFITFKSLDDALDALKASNVDIVPNGYIVNKVFVIGGAILADYAIDHRRCRGVYLNMICKYYKCDINLSDNFIENKLSNYEKITESESTVLCKTLNEQVTLKKIRYVYMNHEENAYLTMLNKILTDGDCRATRNGKTYSVFGEKLVFDIGTNGLPLLTTKKVLYEKVIEELLFFLRGNTNTKLLEDKKVMIWHDNTTQKFIDDNNKNLKEYDMGPMYGYQWRHFGEPYKGCHYRYTNGIDQLQIVVDMLVKDPNSRRILMTTLNPEQVDQGVLHPCHGLVVQFYVEKQNRISLQMYQRSADSILGVPFNIASYAILLHVIVNLVNNNVNRNHMIDYVPGRVIMIFGDTHIYSDEKADHTAAAIEQINRKHNTYPFCEFKINKQLKSLDDLNDLVFNDMQITNYISGTMIKAKMLA